jgi:hypothetical protein
MKSSRYLQNSPVLHDFAFRLARRMPIRSRDIGRTLTRADWGAALLVWLVASVLLLAFETYLQNAHIETTNGLWDSIELRQWLDHPSWAGIDFGNAIYLPVYGGLCEALTWIGVFPDMLWRQMTVLDAVLAAFGLAGVYLFVAAWLRNRRVASLAVALYGGSAFYLLCSMTDEWDMPPQSFILFATLLACAWFARPNIRRIAAVAVLFSVSWLFEWRVLFPALPPMLLVLFLAPGFLRQRILRPVMFLFFMALLPLGLAVAYFMTGGASLGQGRRFLVHLFWAGKGVGTGWGGFSLVKFPLAVEGIAESFVGARNLWYGAWVNNPVVAAEILGGMLICAALGGIALRYVWRHRDDDAVLLSGILLGGMLAAGTVFNLYAQPQDPQMLLNVMVWTVPAWALVAHAAFGGPQAASQPGQRASGPHWRGGLRLFLVAAMVSPAAYNIQRLAQDRGQDQTYIALLARLKQHFDPRRTVFLYQGFEGIVTWQFAAWDGSWNAPSALPPAPTPQPTFKFIQAIGISVNHPGWSVAEQVAELEREINTALDRGYQVVAGPEFMIPETAWVSGFLTVAPPAVPQAMRRMMDADFRLTPVYDDAFGGEYAIVTRSSKP